MQLSEREFNVRLSGDGAPVLESLVHAMDREMSDGQVPLRFVVTASDGAHYRCEVGVQVGGARVPASIFDFVHRRHESVDTFNAVMLVPTGIGAEIGGHAGDATPAAKLLASVCDTLITHPNVLNASDIIEIPHNTLYVEGSVISRLLMGTVGLRKVRANRVLVAVHEHSEGVFTKSAINAVNAARASYGLVCPRVVRLDQSFEMGSLYTASGRASGEVRGMDGLLAALERYRSDYDAVAVSSIITIPESYHRDYFAGGGAMVNPWGGVEALLTHALSSSYNVPTAHSPMLESQEIANMDVGVVDPRMAAEVVSVTFLLSVLKGLQQSPAIVDAAVDLSEPGVLTARDVSCLVIPDGCVGLPTLAALEQGIPVVAVHENRNLMQNDLSALPWSSDQLHFVENYWEAAGVLAALKTGIDPGSVRRPIGLAEVDVAEERESLTTRELATRLSTF